MRGSTDRLEELRRYLHETRVLGGRDGTEDRRSRRDIAVNTVGVKLSVVEDTVRFRLQLALRN
jgi:hypothetical protein